MQSRKSSGGLDLASSPFDELDHGVPEGLVEVRTIEEALRLLQGWISAYARLELAYGKLHADCEAWCTLAKNEEALRRHGVALLPTE